MGFADYAWRHPASFRKRHKQGQTIIITFKPTAEGLAAYNVEGAQLFSLAYSVGDGFRMLNREGEAVLLTKPSGQNVDVAVVEDRSGRLLTTLDKQVFSWDAATYGWKTQPALNLNGSTTFELKQIVSEGKTPSPLATLRLPGNLEASAAELSVQPSADGLPLGLLIFQALMIEHQWTRLKVLAPLKRLSFSSKWL